MPKEALVDQWQVTEPGRDVGLVGGCSHSRQDKIVPRLVGCGEMMAHDSPNTVPGPRRELLRWHPLHGDESIGQQAPAIRDS